MILLSIEEILSLHSKLIAKTGGADGQSKYNEILHWIRTHTLTP